MKKIKEVVVLVLSLLAIGLSFTEFLRRIVLPSKLFALLFCIVALYLFVTTIKDLSRKQK